MPGRLAALAAVLALALSACGGSDNSSGSSGSSGGGDAAGAKVFSDAGCKNCHTLKAAGATGSVGPNLDQLKPGVDLVIHQVNTGGGAMPSFKGKLSDAQIKAVAEYVSKSAASD